jgi:hypothetical protein
MTQLNRYRQKQERFVVAVPLQFHTDGFVYHKWGGEQRCKRGDWIVDNDGDFYTVDADVFQRTYREVRRGAYRKITPIWAEIAQDAGQVKTKEGVTQYEKGDYLVSNNEDGTDAYAMTASKFELSYELDE